MPDQNQQPWLRLMKEHDALNPSPLNSQTYQEQFAKIIEEHKTFNQTKPQGVMHEQTRFYASKVNDLHFLEANRRFDEATMLPVNCGYGLATDKSLEYGPTFCFTDPKNPKDFLAGFNRDIKLRGILDDTLETFKTYPNAINNFLDNGCLGLSKRERNENARYRKTKDYDLWLENFWPFPEQIAGEDLDRTGKIFIKPHEENGVSYLKCTVYPYPSKNNDDPEPQEHLLKIIKDEKGVEDVDLTAFPDKTDIGYYRPYKEAILKHLNLFDGRSENRAKLHKTPQEFENSLRKRWLMLQKSITECRPVFYRTASGKIKDNAADYAFYLKRHSRRANAPQFPCKSFKYNQALIKLSLKNLSHLIITEGVVGKASIGNVLWLVTAQQMFLTKHKKYLPIHIYNHQTGLHQPIPEENLKFLYALSYLVEILGDALDKDFYYLLEEEGQDKYTALTTTDGIAKACDKILNANHLKLALSQANTDPLKIELLLEYISPRVLKELHSKEPLVINQLKTFVAQNDNLKTLLDSKLKVSIEELEEVVKATDLPRLKLILEYVQPSELQKCTPKLINALRDLCTNNGKWFSLVLLDVKINDTKRLYTQLGPNNKKVNLTLAMLAANKPDWEQVLEIASFIDKCKDVEKPIKDVPLLSEQDYKKAQCGGIDYKTYKSMKKDNPLLSELDYNNAQCGGKNYEFYKAKINEKRVKVRETYPLLPKSEFYGLDYAFYQAALKGRWDVVQDLIVHHQMNNYDFNTEAGYVIHLAIKAKRLDIVKLMQENQRPGQKISVIEQRRAEQKSPLVLAATTPGMEHIFSYLLEQGASYEELLKEKASPDYPKYIDFIISYAPFTKEKALPFIAMILDTPNLISKVEEFIEKLLVKVRDIAVNLKKNLIKPGFSEPLKELLNQTLLLPPEELAPPPPQDLPPPYFEDYKPSGDPLIPGAPPSYGSPPDEELPGYDIATAPINPSAPPPPFVPPQNAPNTVRAPVVVRPPAAPAVPRNPVSQQPTLFDPDDLGPKIVPPANPVLQILSLPPAYDKKSINSNLNSSAPPSYADVPPPINLDPAPSPRNSNGGPDLSGSAASPSSGQLPPAYEPPANLNAADNLNQSNNADLPVNSDPSEAKTEPSINANENPANSNDKEAILTIFLAKHKQSFSSGLFSFFHRTTLTAFYEKNERPTPQDLIAHAQRSTFFGFKNRTRLILEDMKIMDENGDVKNPCFK